ncbi:hypothetical protein, partial [Leuconostoc mesenteroides]|uniref:hypothetical protein n=1 Tax=Leuconostoc mesenteroides TaxID=1245 RepID=UPI001CBB6525
MTVTGIKVSEGNGLTTSYTEEQLQGMGFNVNLTAGKGFYAYLPSQDGSKIWDTSNLTVNVDVKLENGQTTTFTDKIIPSPSNEDDSIKEIHPFYIVYSNGNTIQSVFGTMGPIVGTDKILEQENYRNSAAAWFDVVGSNHKLLKFANKYGIVTEFNSDGSISKVYYDQAYDNSNPEIKVMNSDGSLSKVY